LRLRGVDQWGAQAGGAIPVRAKPKPRAAQPGQLRSAVRRHTRHPDAIDMTIEIDRVELADAVLVKQLDAGDLFVLLQEGEV
jgi:hypothetical protein